MALFARKLDYAARDGESGATFLALLEIAKRKGRRAVYFVLYHFYVNYSGGQCNFRMILLRKPRTAEEAKKYFPFAEKSKFPGYESILWRKTTGWLYSAGAGGSYQRMPENSWFRVPLPNPWSARRKKKPLVVGNTAHFLFSLQHRLRSLEELLEKMSWRLNDFEEYDSDDDCNFVPDHNLEGYNKVKAEMGAVEDQIEAVKLRILNVKDELRFALARKKGVPYWPRETEYGTVKRPETATVI